MARYREVWMLLPPIWEFIIESSKQVGAAGSSQKPEAGRIGARARGSNAMMGKLRTNF